VAADSSSSLVCLGSLHSIVEAGETLSLGEKVVYRFAVGS
jgi:hypothetical protein